jgi:hypothetical protein
MKQEQGTKTYWISLDILSWETFPEGGVKYEDMSGLLRRPYHLLRHAEDKLRSTPSELDLVDVITTLKRAAFHRKGAIDKHYALKHIPISDLPKDPLERLAFFGIVKPIVLGALVDIRNSIEHSDGSPPGLERCKEMVEYVWYFLRSTDALIRSIPKTYILGTDDSDDPKCYCLNIHTGPSNDWRVETHGWLPDSMITMSERAGSCLVEGNLQRAKDHARAEGRHRSPEDAFINGKVLGPRGELVRLYRHYFSQA